MAFISRDQSQLLWFPEVRVGVGSDDAEVRPVNVASLDAKSVWVSRFLSHRVMENAQKAERIWFSQSDAVEVLSRYASLRGAMFFMNPR